MSKRIQEDSAEYDMQFYMRKCDELKTEVERLQRDLESKQLIHVGFTNNNQINYAKDEEGAFYPDTDNDCWIPLYMLAIHAHRCGYDSETFCRLAQLEKERDQLKAQVNGMKQAIDDLVRNSEGVAGLHQNGEMAPWDDLLTGGRFEEWLAVFDETPEQSLAAHDAAVIERALELIGYPCTRHKDFGVDYTKGFNSACEMISQQAKQLRQQAQSETPLKDNQ